MIIIPCNNNPPINIGKSNSCTAAAAAAAEDEEDLDSTIKTTILKISPEEALAEKKRMEKIQQQLMKTLSKTTQKNKRMASGR